jgi:hypothetical protein
MKMKMIRFNEWDCRLRFNRYTGNDRLAILLVTEDGEPLLTATVNVPCYPLEDDEVMIKSYAENDGVLECLTDVGVIAPTGKTLEVGHAIAHVCRFLMLDEMKMSMH